MLWTAAALSALLLSASAKNATTLPAVPRDKSTPVQQRLAFNGPNTMAVSWNSEPAFVCNLFIPKRPS